MKRNPTSTIAAAAAAIALLALPAAASAHPGVYAVTAKVATGQTYVGGDTTGASLTNQTQYAIANDGYPLGLTENNGVTGVQPDGTAGMVNYKVMPGTWRAGMTAEQKRTYPGAQTDVQPHATCVTPALSTSATVLAWQGADPFYNYIPFQKAAVGLGDDPTKWIPVVKTATGVDLDAIATIDPSKPVNDAVNTAPFKTACEALPGPGVYHKADTNSSIATALIADTKAPLQTQITTLTDQVTALQTETTTLGQAKAAAEQTAATAQAEKTAADAATTVAQGEATTAKDAASKAQAAAANAEAARKTLEDRPLELTLASKTFAAGSGVAQATGKSGTSVKVTVELTSAAAKKLGVSSKAVSSKTTSLGGQGAALVSLTPSKAVAKALKKKKGSFAVTVTATADGKTKTASASLTR